jgi:uncharacterized phage protein (TIGR02220 family)
MEQYFITLQSFTLEEYEVWRQLNKHCNYDTNIAGYTVNQLVVNSDERLNLTTKRVRNILKKFEKEGYIKLVKAGCKGKESTLEITIKGQLFGNNGANKNEELQQVDDTKGQQKGNNGATLSKNKDKNNNIYGVVIDYLNIKANTSYRINTKNTQSLINARIKEGFAVEDFKKVIDSKSKEWLGTDFEKYLRPATLFGGKFENYLNEANKKAPVGSGTQKNNLVNSNICNSRRKYTQSCDIG